MEITDMFLGHVCILPSTSAMADSLQAVIDFTCKELTRLDFRISRWSSKKHPKRRHRENVLCEQKQFALFCCS